MWLFQKHKLQKPAIIQDSHVFSYEDLITTSNNISTNLQARFPKIKGERIAFMAPPSFEYVATLIGIWKTGGIAVPLALKYPESELAYIMENSQCVASITTNQYFNTVQSVASKTGIPNIAFNEIQDSSFELTKPFTCPHNDALILYTSGTTSKPKGVVITHKNLEFQTECLSKAWQWSSYDRILSVLPLHHIHGLVNVVLTTLRSNAQIEFLPVFDSDIVWQAFIDRPLTLFMAVPTIYSKLIEHFERASSQEQDLMKNACKKFRLMVSGSAALPVSVLENWEKISGQRLLERYGMTEIGMALSNPYEGERHPGTVGHPLPGVEVKLVDEVLREITTGQKGEILVKGQNVFSRYWNEPEMTANSFHNGWFRTGDIATVENGYFRILGRNSVDIIKSGGFKISALEIEEVLRSHPSIVDCAVVGTLDNKWGEIIQAAIVWAGSGEPNEVALKNWMKDRLAPYKIPKTFHPVDSLPRNALGKVIKPLLIKRLFTT